ncbi:glycosyltransferase family 2 protein [Pseudomonas aeruginosa]
MALVDDGSQPLVSVIIASYNHEKYIEASIASVAAQTYRNVELLVVDDGSSDGSVELLRGLQAKYGFDLRVQQNQGLSRTLNEAIARARGNLIVPFGSDDIMLPQRLEKQVAHMWDKPEVGICAGNIEIIDSMAGSCRERSARKRDLPFRRLDFSMTCSWTASRAPMAPTLMFRREALEKVGGFDPDIRLEDVYIELAVTKAGYVIDILGEVLAQYRKHPTNTYKNARFMVDNVFKTLQPVQRSPRLRAGDHALPQSECSSRSNRDKVLARSSLSGLPLKYWNEKTFRGIARLFFS